MKKLCLIAVVLCVLAASCQTAPRETGMPLPDQPPSIETDRPSPAPPDEVYAPDLLVEEKYWREDYYADDGTLLLSVSYACPAIPEDFPFDLGNSYATRFANALHEADELLALAREDYARQPDGFVPHSWEQNFSVAHNDGKYLSILFEDTRYSGGVHGSDTVETHNIRLSDACFLTLDDLFIVDRASYVSRLTPLICAQIVPGAEDYYPNYEESVKDMFPTDLFCLTGDGLALFYQPYQLAPYTQGVRRFELPFEAYEDIWKG